MSIFEDLDLMDLPDDLPDGMDFDLDDILLEFSTPGLYAAPARLEAKEEEIPPFPELPQDEDEDVSTALKVDEDVDIIFDEYTGEEIVLHPTADKDEPVAPALDLDIPEFPEPPMLLDEDEDEDEEEEEEESYKGDLYGNPFGLGDILYEFGAPVDEDGVKVYTPAAKEQSTDEEDDVKVYAPPVKESAEEQPTP